MRKTSAHKREGLHAFSDATPGAQPMAAVMEEAHARLCQVAAELIAEHFIWKSPEARTLLESFPLLNDPRLDRILAHIRKGAAHPCDCGTDLGAYLAEILVSSLKIRDFNTRREHIDGYRRLSGEYALLNRLAEAWQGGEREAFEAAFEEFQRHLAGSCAPDRSRLIRAHVADAPAVPEPLFRHGPAPGGFGLIVGADGVGKGWLTLDLLLGCALASVMNIPTFRRVGPPLRVLYLCYEDDPRVLRWRLDRVCESAGVDPDAWRDAEHGGGLRFAADLEPLFIQGGHGAPQPTDTFRALSRTLKAEPADLCIIDPLAAAALVQSENDNSALNAVAVTLRDLARDTGCAILLTHHTSKAARDAADHHASRGGSALTGAARWVLRLIQDGNDRARLKAGIPKNSYGRALGEIVLQRLDQGVLRELSGTCLGKQKEALVEDVIRFVNENPDIEINPKAVCRSNSPGAKALIARLNSSAKAVSEAVERALDAERLQLETRRRPNSRNTFQVLVPWKGDDPEFVPF
jgi:hypothetical protein